MVGQSERFGHGYCMLNQIQPGFGLGFGQNVQSPLPGAGERLYGDQRQFLEITGEQIAKLSPDTLFLFS